MTLIAEALAEAELKVVRFEFAYMAQRRVGGSRKPPPKAEKMIPEFEAALEALDTEVPLIIGGKSMGGRIASMIADGLLQTKRISGLLCIGYPFHPIGKPDKLRTDHLRDLQTPTLICQGTRDPFGTAEEVAAYDLSEAIEITFDPAVTSFREMLVFFFQIHDPTTSNRQGNDMGMSYRSAIYITSEEQKTVAVDTIADVDASGLWPGKVVTEVAPVSDFWLAEPEHQDYLQNRPDGYTCHFVRPGWVLPKRAIAS